MNKRNRGRNNNRRHNNNNNNSNNNNTNPNRSMDSNGPDIKVRGNASTIYEKYVTLARDVRTAGSRVKAENYLQHAEHYLRIVQEQQVRAQAHAEQQQARQAAQQAQQQAKQEKVAAERAEREQSSESVEQSDELTQEKPNRSRRSRRSKQPQDTQTDAVATDTSENAEFSTPEVEGIAETVSEDEPVAVKKKPRTRRKKPVEAETETSAE